MNRLNGLDALRGFAATSIVLFHLVGINGLALGNELKVIGTHFGFAVPLFYVVSAFSLYLGYFDKLNNKESIKKYFLRRFLRIAPLFYCMIFIYAFIIVFYFNANLSIKEIILDISFLFGLFPGKHETIVWAGWSIGVEFLFYFILPLLMLNIKNITHSLIFFFLFIIIGTYTQNFLHEASSPANYEYENLFTHMPFFIAGIVAYFIYEFGKNNLFLNGNTFNNSLLLVSFILATLLTYTSDLYILLAKVTYLNLPRYAWALIFSIWVLSFSLRSTRVFVNRLTVFLGTISFSIYLWHPLIVYFLKPAHLYIYNQYNFGSNISFILSAILTFSMLIPVAYLSFRYIEKPFIELGRIKIKGAIK